jgi:hypothetical protein
MNTNEENGQEKESRVPDIAIHADNYVRDLIAFNEICTEASAKKTNLLKNWVAANASHVSGKDFEDLGKFLDDFIEMMRKASAQLAGDKFEPVSINISNPEIAAISETLTMDLVFRGIPDRSNLVNRASLIAAVSAFEVLFGQLVRTVCNYNPSALSRSEYSFTLEELSQFSSIDEARQALVTRKIEALLMESIDGWDKWVERTVKITFADTVGDWPLIREIFARRNILVHADGLVSKRYLEDLRRSGISTDAKLGELVDLSIKYISDALERLAALGMLLAFRVWTRLRKSEVDEAARWLISRQEVLIRCEMWTAVHLISSHLSSVNCRRNISLQGKTHGWLARKRINGVDAIREEVNSWDVTGLMPTYAVIRKLLINDFDGMEAAIERELKSGRIRQFQVATDPLFAEFRKLREGKDGEAVEGNDVDVRVANGASVGELESAMAVAGENSPDERDDKGPA